MSDINSPGKNWRVILTLILSALGVVYYFVQALLLVVVWIVFLANPVVEILGAKPLSLLIWASILNGVLMIPILVLSILEYQRKPVPSWLDLSNPALSKLVSWSMIVWPFVVLAGWLVADRDSLAVLFLGLINVLVVSLPILWIFQAAQRKLPGGTHIQKWRIFGFSITVMPMVVIMAELIVMMIFGIFAVIWMSVRLSSFPNIEQEITYLMNQVMAYGDDVESILQLLKPYILQPSVIYWGLALVGGVFPIIEEVLKPLALWSLAGRKLKPSEGFVGGLLCGAGFALIENIFYFTNVSLAEDWVFMAIGRTGTGVLHMLASGLMGWGLAAIWSKRNWLFSTLTTLSAFLLHGVWNVIAMVSGLLPLLIIEKEPTMLQSFLTLVPIFFLLVISLGGLVMINRYLHSEQENNSLNTDKITIEDRAQL